MAFFAKFSRYSFSKHSMRTVVWVKKDEIEINITSIVIIDNFLDDTICRMDMGHDVDYQFVSRREWEWFKHVVGGWDWNNVLVGFFDATMPRDDFMPELKIKQEQSNA